MHAQQASAAQLARLVARAREGDRGAFDRLVEAYTPRVYNLALRVTGCQEEAEDCVQEAFVRAFVALPKFRGEAAFSTWLYRVALNVANDAARRRAGRPLAASELAADGSDDAPRELDRWRNGNPAPVTPPEDAVVAEQRRQVILRAIRALPEHYRSVLVLYDLQGFTYQQIAEITRTRVGTVKSRLNRARLALKERLAPHMELLRD